MKSFVSHISWLFFCGALIAPASLYAGLPKPGQATQTQSNQRTQSGFDPRQQNFYQPWQQGLQTSPSFRPPNNYYNRASQGYGGYGTSRGYGTYRQRRNQYDRPGHRVINLVKFFTESDGSFGGRLWNMFSQGIFKPIAKGFENRLLSSFDFTLGLDRVASAYIPGQGNPFSRRTQRPCNPFQNPLYQYPNLNQIWDYQSQGNRWGQGQTPYYY